jgi:hypothetical protein
VRRRQRRPSYHRYACSRLRTVRRWLKIDPAQKKVGHLAQRVKPHLARGSHERMPVQNDESSGSRARVFSGAWLRSSSSAANSSWLKPPIFRNAAVSQKMNEPASSFCKTGWRSSTSRCDDAGDRECFSSSRIVAPPARHLPEMNLLRDVGKQFRAGMRIGIHKNQPVAGRRRRAGIPRAGDLVDRLKHDRRARRRARFPPCGRSNCYRRRSIQPPSRALRERAPRRL